MKIFLSVLIALVGFQEGHPAYKKCELLTSKDFVVETVEEET